MPSVLEKLGLIGQPDSTSIPQLSISNPVFLLQKQSEKYFKIEPRAEAADGNKLAVKIIDGNNFSLKNPEHIKFLEECTALVKEKASVLTATDGKLVTSVVFGVAATALSFLSVIGLLGWVGWGAAVYYMKQRTMAYMEYKESLKLLVAACNWALGEGPESRKNMIKELVENEAIRGMMKVLYPLLTEDQVKHMIADDIENIFIAELAEYETRMKACASPHRLHSKDDKLVLSKRSTEFYRCIYGLNKGGVSDFFDAILSLIPDIYRMIVHGCEKLKYWWLNKPEADKPQLANSEPSNIGPKVTH